MRKVLHIALSGSILASLCLAFVSYQAREWSTLTAVISLLIAIISAWVAYETFYQLGQAERPQLTLSFDSRSRAELILLRLENHGKRAAFNVSIKWNKTLPDRNGVKIGFNDTASGVQVNVINGGEYISTLVCGSFQLNEFTDLDYSGEVTYNTTLTGGKRYTTPFYISLQPIKRTLLHTDEKEKSYYSINKLPKILEEMKKDINELSRHIIKQSKNRPEQ